VYFRQEEMTDPRRILVLDKYKHKLKHTARRLTRILKGIHEEIKKEIKETRKSLKIRIKKYLKQKRVAKIFGQLNKRILKYRGKKIERRWWGRYKNRIRRYFKGTNDGVLEFRKKGPKHKLDVILSSLDDTEEEGINGYVNSLRINSSLTKKIKSLGENVSIPEVLTTKQKDEKMHIITLRRINALLYSFNFRRKPYLRPVFKEFYTPSVVERMGRSGYYSILLQKYNRVAQQMTYSKHEKENSPEYQRLKFFTLVSGYKPVELYWRKGQLRKKEDARAIGIYPLKRYLNKQENKSLEREIGHYKYLKSIEERKNYRLFEFLQGEIKRKFKLPRYKKGMFAPKPENEIKKMDEDVKKQLKDRKKNKKMDYKTHLRRKIIYDELRDRNKYLKAVAYIKRLESKYYNGTKHTTGVRGTPRPPKRKKKPIREWPVRTAIFAPKWLFLIRMQYRDKLQELRSLKQELKLVKDGINVGISETDVEIGVDIVKRKIKYVRLLLWCLRLAASKRIFDVQPFERKISKILSITIPNSREQAAMQYAKKMIPLMSNFRNRDSKALTEFSKLATTFMQTFEMPMIKLFLNLFKRYMNIHLQQNKVIENKSDEDGRPLQGKYKKTEKDDKKKPN